MDRKINRASTETFPVAGLERVGHEASTVQKEKKKGDEAKIIARKRKTTGSMTAVKDLGGSTHSPRGRGRGVSRGLGRQPWRATAGERGPLRTGWR